MFARHPLVVRSKRERPEEGVLIVVELNENVSDKFVIGTVSSFDNSKGWGFIAVEGTEKDVFVHHDAIEGECARVLAVGDRVRFELVRGPKGPRAASVKKIAPGADGDSPKIDV